LSVAVFCSPGVLYRHSALRSAKRMKQASQRQAFPPLKLVPAVSCLACGTEGTGSAERIRRAASVRLFLLPYVAILSKRSVTEQK
jgi:hypothetical protein